jgi:hypothetical protein
MPSVLTFTVDGYPPAKAEATSMLGGGHPHRARVRALLEAAAAAATADNEFSAQLTERVGLELVLYTPEAPASDATNYLGGVGDVLESKTHRGALEHLGELASVALYANDRQIQEVHYRREPADEPRYTVRMWVLDSPSADAGAVR